MGAAEQQRGAFNMHQLRSVFSRRPQPGKDSAGNSLDNSM